MYVCMYVLLTKQCTSGFSPGIINIAGGRGLGGAYDHINRFSYHIKEISMGIEGMGGCYAERACMGELYVHVGQPLP